MSSSRSLAVSSPIQEEETHQGPPRSRRENRDSSSARSRNQSEEESTHESSRKRRRKDGKTSSETEKRKKRLTSRWNGQHEPSEEDSTDLPDVDDTQIGNKKRAEEISVMRDERKKSRRERLRKKSTRSSESQETTRSVMSSPRSWELLMNGTRFLTSGPVTEPIAADQNVPEEEEEEEDDKEMEFEDTEANPSHFVSMDLERAKRDQHLQPRVVLEPLRISLSSEIPVHQSSGIIYEDEVEKEDEEDEAMETLIEESKEENLPRVQVNEKPEIRDILSMLDSTGSPVLATDTPPAHLPSSMDSTKTIRGRQEDREISKEILQLSQNVSKSTRIKNSTQEASSKFLDGKDGVSRLGGSGRIRRDLCERVDSSVNDLGSSSEILEALRSTPGLSVSVTRRLPAENRLESPEHSGGTRTNTTKRPNSSIYLERLLPSPKNNVVPPCCSSSEVTCSEDANREITLEGILATPSRLAPPERICGSGLAAVVNRLANRKNDAKRVQDGNSLESQRKIVEREPVKRPSKTVRIRGERRSQPDRTNNLRQKDAAKQLRDLVKGAGDVIPDPLLVPRDRLPALAAAPALEIPKLLASRPELRLPEALTRPDLLRDPDLLVISLAHLQHVLDQGEGPVTEYNYRPPRRRGGNEGDDDEFDEADEFFEEDDDEEEEEEEEEEDQDVPEQSLGMERSENRRRCGISEELGRKTQRSPPKLISCKPIGSLMPGPIDLSRGCVRSVVNSRTSQGTLASMVPGFRQQDALPVQLPPPPLLRVRTGLLKQESEVTSTEISPNFVQDDSHLWHPLFGRYGINVLKFYQGRIVFLEF